MTYSNTVYSKTVDAKVSATTDLGCTDIRWDLSDLYNGIDDPKLTADIQSVKDAAKTFEQRYKTKIKSLSTQELKDAYVEMENFLTPLYKAGQFVSLSLTTNTADNKIKALQAKIDEEESEISNMLVFFDLECGAMSETDFKSHYEDPSFQNYAYSLKRSVETASYNLTEPEEKMVNIKDMTGSDAFKKLYEEYVSSFEFEFELDGKKQTMNGSQLRSLRTHEDKDVRRRAMKTFFSRYEQDELIFSHIYNNVIKDYNLEKNLRNYPSAISRRNVGNDLTDETVQALHDVTTESLPLVHDYYKIKKDLLNLPDMTLADIYAPMPESPKTFLWQDAKDLVLNGFSAFDNEFYQFAKDMFDENRIDAPVEPKKRGGAFCSASTPDVKPYVMLNFLGKPRDVATIAHELGHAIHDLYARKQTLTNYHPILPLAETASVFCEMIITDLLLKQETDPGVKRAILTDKIEDIFATSHRQNMFSRFEIQSHERINKQIMSSEELCDLYESELKLMFGDVVNITPEYRWEWSTIPHIVEYPFYVYAYNFGNLLVMALYQQYKEEGSSFIPKLKDVLAAGSFTDPITITSKVGIDIRKPAFWQKSMTLIEGYIEQLKALT